MVTVSVGASVVLPDIEIDSPTRGLSLLESTAIVGVGSDDEIGTGTGTAMLLPACLS
jgi:hypothetical protein